MNNHQFCPSTKARKCLLCGEERDHKNHAVQEMYVVVWADEDGVTWAEGYDGDRSERFDTVGVSREQQDFDVLRAVQQVLDKQRVKNG